MNIKHIVSHTFNSIKKKSIFSRIQLVIFLGFIVSIYQQANAGGYIFADEVNGINIVTHPSGYSGTGGEVVVNVCIDPTSPNASNMEIPTANTVAVFNELESTTGNLRVGNLSATQFDFESVLLHELGHCIGLSHPNLGVQTGVPADGTNYTHSTDGVDNIFNLNAGLDECPAGNSCEGSSDDIRGDDVNMHWYRKSNNNPFTIAPVVDSTTYVRDLAEALALGHTFATNADRNVSELLGVPRTEAVMQQGTSNFESQRTLGHDDVATVRYAMSGLDEIAGTADDYTIRLNSLGMSNDASCDINIDFDSTQTGFAVCQAGGTFLAPNHIQITSANIYFHEGFNWLFNTAQPCTASTPLTAGQWKMWSLGCDVGISTSATVANVIGDDLAGVYGTDWEAYRRDPANNTYQMLSLTDTLQEHEGYWVISQNAGQTINVEGQYNSEFEQPLAANSTNGRFNMVGHPFRFVEDWADVRVIDSDSSMLTLDQADPLVGVQRACSMVPVDASCIMSRTMYKWNGGAYEAFDGSTPGMEGQLNISDGLWVRAYKDGIALRIPASTMELTTSETLGENQPLQVASTEVVSLFEASAENKNDIITTDLGDNPVTTEKVNSAKLNENEWYVRLTAQTDNYIDSANVFGRLKNSRYGPDAHDLKELASFDSKYLTIVFPQPKWGKYAGNYTTDFRRARKNRSRGRWNFQVKSSLIGEEVTLIWEGPEDIVENSILIDRTTSERFLPDANGRIRFTQTAKTHDFRWLVNPKVRKRLEKRLEKFKHQQRISRISG